jgi:hypothetical protein
MGIRTVSLEQARKWFREGTARQVERAKGIINHQGMMYGRLRKSNGQLVAFPMGSGVKA